jgi:cytidylate kinase
LLGLAATPIIDSMSETAEAFGHQGDGHARRTVPRVIAVDGSAASGKSSVGRRLAAKLGYPFLDTGVMYRAITLAALDAGVNTSDQQALTQLARDAEIEVAINASDTIVEVSGRDVSQLLRRPDVEESVSLVSRVPGVRDALVEQQRSIAEDRAIVMAGRDIGTVVLPHADLKLYLDAGIDERAARRHREFETLGRETTHDEVLADIRRRDRIDSERDVSPLRAADDAVVINTDGLTLDDVMARVMAIIDEGG